MKVHLHPPGNGRGGEGRSLSRGERNIGERSDQSLWIILRSLGIVTGEVTMLIQ